MLFTKLNTMSTEERELMTALMNAKNEYIEAVKGFEEVTDELLVDYFTYRIQACQARYQFFLQKAKEFGLKGIEEINITFEGSNHAS